MTAETPSITPEMTEFEETNERIVDQVLMTREKRQLTYDDYRLVASATARNIHKHGGFDFSHLGEGFNPHDVARDLLEITYAEWTDPLSGNINHSDDFDTLSRFQADFIERFNIRTGVVDTSGEEE